MVLILLGGTVFVKNSSVPLLEASLEIDSEVEQIQRNDLMYLMKESEEDMPQVLSDLDPRRK